MYLWCQVPSSSLVLSEGIGYMWSCVPSGSSVTLVPWYPFQGYPGGRVSGGRVFRVQGIQGKGIWGFALLPPPDTLPHLKPQKHPTGILFCFCFVLVPLSLNYCILFITGLFLLLRCSCSIKHKQKSWPKEAGLSWFTLLFHYCCSPF